MQFMLMCCFDEKRWNGLPDAERDRIMEAYGKWVMEGQQSGRLLSGAKLDECASAVTVREKNGKSALTDGPFTETKEQLGGYHVVECAAIDEAIALAQKIPTLPAGGTIEVRPVLQLE